MATWRQWARRLSARSSFRRTSQRSETIGLISLANPDYPTDDNSQAQRDFEQKYLIFGPHLGLLEQHIQRHKDSYRGVASKGLPVIIDSRKQVPTRYVVRVLNEVVRAEIQDVQRTIGGEVTLSEVQAGYFRDTRLYIQLQSEDYPDGLLRGWLVQPEDSTP